MQVERQAAVLRNPSRLSGSGELHVPEVAKRPLCNVAWIEGWLRWSPGDSCSESPVPGGGGLL